MMKRVLLIGGAGFIGINVAERLMFQGYQVVIGDVRPLSSDAGTYLSQYGEVAEVHCDITKLDEIARVIKEYRIEYLIQASAVTPRDREEIEKLAQILSVNCVGTANLLQAACQYGIKRYLYLGSVAVYGDVCQHKTEICESDHDYNPKTIYELTKFFSEKMILRYAELTGLRAYILRIGDTFGPWERPTDVRSVMSAPCQVMERLEAGDDIRLQKTGKMHWIYSKDVARCAEAILSGKPKHRIYHASSEACWSVYEFAEYLCRYYPGRKVSLVEKNPNVTFFSELDNGAFSMERMAADLEVKLLYDKTAAANDYHEWYLKMSR